MTNEQAKRAAYDYGYRYENCGTMILLDPGPKFDEAKWMVIELDQGVMEERFETMEEAMIWAFNPDRRNARTSK